MIEPGGYVPIDRADIVAELVLTDFGELHASSFEYAVVFAGEDLVHDPTGLDLDLSDFFEKLSGFH